MGYHKKPSKKQMLDQNYQMVPPVEGSIPIQGSVPSRPMHVGETNINNGYASRLASQNLPINPVAPNLYQYDNKVQSVKQDLMENKDEKYAGDVADETAQKDSVDYSKFENKMPASTTGTNTGINISKYGGDSGNPIYNVASSKPKINKPGWLSKKIFGEPTMSFGGKTYDQDMNEL